jgi:hypothetical protein
MLGGCRPPNITHNNLSWQIPQCNPVSGHIGQGRHVQGTQYPRAASSKGRIVQGTERSRLFVWGHIVGGHTVLASTGHLTDGDRDTFNLEHYRIYEWKTVLYSKSDKKKGKNISVKRRVLCSLHNEILYSTTFKDNVQYNINLIKKYKEYNIHAATTRRIPVKQNSSSR